MIDTKSRFIVLTNKEASHQDNLIGRPRVKHSVLDPLIRMEAEDIELMERPTPEDLARATDFGSNVIIVWGGDGSLNWILNNIPQDGRNVAILPLAGGNANDTSRSLYGYHSLQSILEAGEIADAYSLEARVRTVDKSQYSVLGIGYISIGATAEAAEELEKDREDPLTRIEKYQKAAIGMARAGIFEYIDSEGNLQEAYNISAQNGRMAQVLWPYQKDTRFCEETFDLTISRSRSSFVAQGARSIFAWKKPNHVSEFSFSIPDHSIAVAIQADGEPFPRLEPGSEIQIGHNGLVKLVRLPKL